MNSPVSAVLYISFGGPEKREDIMPFLEGISARLPAGRQGRAIPKVRLEEVAHHYEKIGGASPLNEITRQQASALQSRLAEDGHALPVYIAQRNWHPFIEDTLRRMAGDGIHRAVGFITAAHRCEASHERYVNAVEDVRQKIGPTAPQIDYVSPWFDHPLFIEAICERILNVLPSPDEGTSWIFTAHSIPLPMAEASHYVQELTRTAELVSEKMGVESWTLAYTSRSGRPTDPWLEPDVCDVIHAQAARGVRNVLAVPIGFVADHVEVLYDLDVEAKEAAEQAGVHFYRAGTVGSHPLFIKMMADVIKKTALVKA